MKREPGRLDSWPLMKMWISHFTFLIFLSNKMKVTTFLTQAMV